MTVDDQPRNSQAAIFREVGRAIELELLPIPELSRHEALVRVTCCTLCGSDLHTITGKRKEAVPSILGHEALGVVICVGSPAPSDLQGQPLQVGDRVTWSTCICCGRCDLCAAGFSQKCRQVKKYGHSPAEGRTALNGGLSEYLLLQPGSSIIKLNTDIPDEVLCPANCATATIAAAYRLAGHITGKRVLIFGAGMLGLTATAFAKFHNASHIVVCDVDPGRLSWAKRFGADGVVEWHTDEQEFLRRLSPLIDPPEFDILLELSGSPEAIESAVRLGAIGARMMLVGSVMPSRLVQLDPERIVRRWLSLQGIHNYAPEDLVNAVGFLAEAHDLFPFHELVAAAFPLQDISAAIDYAIEHKPIRVAVRP